MKDTIAEGLSSARRKLSRLNQPDLHRVKVESVAKELELEGEARKLAAAGLPAPDQTALSAPEAKAVQRVESARQALVRWASSRLTEIEEDVARRDVTALVNDALGADRAFDRRASGAMAEHEHLVQELADHAAARERELEDFKARHGLTRPATYPEGSATFARYAILLVLIVVEGVANAYFFSLGLESGLIGGFLAAGLFAAVNLVTAFVLGKFAVPLVFHRERALTVLGTAAVVFAVLWMISVGLAIAHFRDSLIMDAAEPARTAWAAMKASPLGLRDVMSWLLFAISMLFAVFALFDGLSSDDRYPGYGAVSRRARQTRDDYLGELQAIRRLLEDAKKDALEAIDGNLRTARTCVAETAALIRDKKWARTQLDAALLDAENCLDTLLTIFRDTNAMHRGALPKPAYFGTRPALQALAIPDFHTDADAARLKEQEALVERLAREADALRAAIEASFKDHASKLRLTLRPAHAPRLQRIV